MIDATRATCSRDRGDNLLVPQVGSPDLVRSVGHNLVRAEDAVLDEPAYAIVRDAEGRSGFRHREPLAVLLGGAVGVDAVHPPQRADTVGRPSLPLARRNSIRFNLAAMSSSDQRVAMLRITARASSGVRQPCSPDFGLRIRNCEC